jgi:hypothetical protein
MFAYNLSARAGSLCWDIPGSASAGRQLDIPGGISILCFLIHILASSEGSEFILAIKKGVH